MSFLEPQPGNPDLKRPSEWSELEESDPEFQKYLMEKLRVIMTIKKFGRRWTEEYRRLRLTRPIGDEVIEIKIPKSVKELEEMLRTNEQFKKMVVESFKIESSDPLDPEISDFERATASIKEVAGLLAFAESEGITLSKEDIDYARKFALDDLAKNEKKSGTT